MELISRVIRKIRTVIKNRKEKYRFQNNIRLVKNLSDDKSPDNRVIVDCGFNEGVVASDMLKELPGFSLYGFEIQQDIQEFSARLRNRFPNRNVQVLYSAVSDKDGFIEYFEPETWGKNYKGSTTTVKNKRGVSDDTVVPKRAPAIDFSKWLSENVKNEDFVFVKMDIEGAEYDVIEHLMETGVIDLIDVLAVEWHSSKFPEPQASRYKNIENAIKGYAQSHPIVVLDWY